MKNFYALIRFKTHCVTGFLAIGHKDSESARLSIIKNLTDEINEMKEKYKDGGQDFQLEKIERLKSFRSSFTKPHRHITRLGFKGKEEVPVLEMLEIPNDFVIATNHWLSHKSDENTGNLCNLPRERTEHPMGYVTSQLK